MTKNSYNSDYYKKIGAGSANSAAAIIPVVQKLVSPKSVADIGCGTGIWLAEWQRNDVNDIIGIDGAYILKEQLKINADLFIAQDLQMPIQIERKFDLVQSLEVAEHLKPEFAASFIKNLCGLSDLVLFSAAIPAQGGINHFNEQYPDYWISLFSQNNFTPYDCLRKIIWNNKTIDTCYRQNILLFVRNEVSHNYPAVTSTNEPILNLVHPETYDVRNSIIRDYEKITSTVFHANWFIAKKVVKKFLKKLGLWI
jgi:SAM-dependent methyltransferase